MPEPHDPSRLAALGRDWVAAWNARDLKRVLALYAEDAEMTSDRIAPLGFGASGTVHGKERLRALPFATGFSVYAFWTIRAIPCGV